MQPTSVVEDLDVLGNGEPGTGSGVEAVPVVHLVLQRGEEALGDGGVVPAHAGAADAGAYALVGAELRVLAGGVLPRSLWKIASACR